VAGSSYVNSCFHFKAIGLFLDNVKLDNFFVSILWGDFFYFFLSFLLEHCFYWKKFLNSVDYIAVYEASWFTDQRPDEIEAFWMDAYPEIDTIPNKVAQMQRAGYVPVATFVLPDNCWTTHFYAPQVEAQKVFLQQRAGNKTAEDFIANQRHEEQLYNKYKSYYGYVFYIGKKL
jgi:hypothetical protein